MIADHPVAHPAVDSTAWWATARSPIAAGKLISATADRNRYSLQGPLRPGGDRRAIVSIFVHRIGLQLEIDRLSLVCREHTGQLEAS